MGRGFLGGSHSEWAGDFLVDLTLSRKWDFLMDLTLSRQEISWWISLLVGMGILGGSHS